MELKAELQKAKEATEALEQASYDCRVQETEIRLAEDVVEVCRDYYKEGWAEVLNRVGVPTAFEWRNAENIFYPEDIREVPVVLPPTAASALTSSKQPSTTQASLPPSKVSKGLARLVTKGRRLNVRDRAPSPIFYRMLGQTHVNGWSRVIVSQNRGSTSYSFPFKLRVLQWSCHLLNY